jgi:uncharacterized protein
MRTLVAFLVGLLFSIGLAIGGMTDPHKVLAFLDVAGQWDPSLMFVMGAAIGVYAPLFRVVMRRPHPALDRRFHLPTRRDVDTTLLAGAVLFGVGWGLGGYCPGPALTSVASGRLPALVFGAAMLASMAAFSAWERHRTSVRRASRGGPS